MKLAAPGEHAKGVDVEFGPLLGRGTFGAVYRAKLKPGDMEVAVKVFEPPEGRMGALREAMLLDRCAHPRVIKSLDAWSDSKSKKSYLVFPLRATDLERYLRNESGSPTGPLIRLLMEHVLGGVAYIHKQGLIHTDLKPNNIWWKSDAAPDAFYVADLGCCVEAGRPARRTTTWGRG